MYGFPSKERLARLIGKTLLQLCIGSHQVSFIFDDDVRIDIESAISHNRADGTIHIYNEFWNQCTSLPMLLGASITALEVVGKTELILIFSNRDTVRLTDDTEQYEALQIYIGGEILVV